MKLATRLALRYAALSDVERDGLAIGVMFLVAGLFVLVSAVWP